MQISDPKINAPGVYEKVQWGVEYPDGSVIWAEVGTTSVTIDGTSYHLSEPTEDFFIRYPSSTIQALEEKWRKKSSILRVPIADDAHLKTVSRRVTIIVGNAGQSEK